MRTYFLLFMLLLFVISCSNNKTKNQNEKSGKENLEEMEEHPSIHQEEWEENKDRQNSFGDAAMLVEVASVESITDDLSQKFTNPKFTLDGTKIIFTTENFIGLWVYDISKKTIQQINTLPGSGYNFSISSDGAKVYFRNKTSKAKKHSGKYSIIEQDIATKKMNILITSEKRLSTPIILNMTLLFLEDGKLKEIPLKSKTSLGGKGIPPVYFVVDNKLMKFEIGSEPKEISLNKMKIISMKYTSDNKNLVCLTASNGLILLDLSGNVINNFDNAITLTKLYNSSLVAFVEEEDDGTKITKSQMYMGFITSNKKRKIANMKAENIFSPSWSPKENRIVYSTDQGKIKIVKLNIKREEER